MENEIIREGRTRERLTRTNVVPLRIRSFSNSVPKERHLLEEFVQFHWDHYEKDPQFIPLLDYEYLGSKMLMITGFLEGRNIFFKHAESRFFLAYRNGKVVGRCTAFVNYNHNEKWKDRVGFFGQFECINDEAVARELLNSAQAWLKGKGMDTIRGPQNFPVNEATPGVLVEGFNSRPVVYYHYNKPYYASLLKALGFQEVIHSYSYELSFKDDRVKETLEKVSQRVLERNNVTFETWKDRPYKERKREMLEVYNDAWSDNFGFVPFTQEEFDKIIDDTRLVMDPNLFLFVYVKGKLAAFFGGFPNIVEILQTNKEKRPPEIVRAVKLVSMGYKISGLRLGYLGVRREYRQMGLDGLMIWKQVQVAKKIGYEYVDIGWVLETNKPIIRMTEKCGGKFSKKYTLFENKIQLLSSGDN